jgi:hypothetical protein
MSHRHTYGLSFSWRRATGLSAASGRISRAIGVPLTRSGRERKLGRALGGGGSTILLALIILAALRLF